MKSLTRPPKLALVAVLLLLSALFLIQQSHQQSREQSTQNLNQLGETLSEQMSLIIAPLLLGQDWVSLNVSLQQLTQDQLIQASILTGNQGETITQIGSPSENPISQAVTLDGNKLGTLSIYLDPDQLKLSAKQTAQQLTVMISISHLAIFLGICLLMRRQGKAALADDDLTLTETDVSESVSISTDFSAADWPANEQEFPASAAASESSLTVTDENDADWPEATQPLPPSAKDIRYFVIFINCLQGSQHLHDSEREALLGVYQQLFERVCAIYRGAFSGDSEGNWLAQFPQHIQSREENDLQLKLHCGSNALCAAQLFKSLYRKLNQQRIMQMKPVLNLKIGLVAGQEPENLHGRAQTLTEQTESNELMIASELYEFESLRTLLLDAGTVSKAENDCYLVYELAGDFQQLIDRQAEHFLQDRDSTLPEDQPA